jgi:hypothetical protein
MSENNGEQACHWHYPEDAEEGGITRDPYFKDKGKYTQYGHEYEGKQTKDKARDSLAASSWLLMWR